MHALAKTLSDAEVDLVSLNIADTNDFGIVRMITSDNIKAASALKGAGFTVKATDLIGIEVDDVPGGLTKILSVLTEGGIELEYLYSFARVEGKKATILFKTPDMEKALQLLRAHNMG